MVNQMRINYLHHSHKNYPHVVKFSGGRSSAMMLLALAENNQFDVSRGDVIIFNNTSAEHSKTYEFVVKCKKFIEEEYRIPFFIIEFQTYEDAWLGRWRRAPTYRMVKPYPYKKYKKRKSYGYRHQGEVFQEFVSWKAQLPTRFTRTCTEHLKLNTSTRFLEDWFGRCGGRSTPRYLPELSRKFANPRLGHYYPESQMPKPSSYAGRSEKVRYHLEQSSYRDAQMYTHYTDAPLVDFENEVIKDYVYDFKANLRGDEPLKFISLVGLRFDEPIRVTRTLARNNTAEAKGRLADGEFVYAPLFDSELTKEDVLSFWKRQEFDLEIPHNVNLSNCVFCFMKGAGAIQKLASEFSHGAGPGNIQWWADFESKYANRVQSRENKQRVSFFGFFGSNALTYKKLAQNLENSVKENSSGFLPCECTD